MPNYCVTITKPKEESMKLVVIVQDGYKKPYRLNYDFGRAAISNERKGEIIDELMIGSRGDRQVIILSEGQWNKLIKEN